MSSNMAGWNPKVSWRFLARKTSYFYGVFSITFDDTSRVALFWLKHRGKPWSQVETENDLKSGHKFQKWMVLNHSMFGSMVNLKAVLSGNLIVG